LKIIKAVVGESNFSAMRQSGWSMVIDRRASKRYPFGKVCAVVYAGFDKAASSINSHKSNWHC
jgi:hypothetical protein